MSHNAQNPTTTDEALTGRYASTIGWDPNRSKTDERDLAREAKRARDEYRTREALRRAIDVRAARDLMRRDPDEDRQPTNQPQTLFPPFWHPGQLAIITGPPNTGKSLLAVQLAETIAAGTKGPSSSPPYQGGVDAASAHGVVLPSQVNTYESLFTSPVLYLDLARTRRQYRELYTHNRRRYRFSKHLKFGLLADEPTPAGYKSRELFLRDAIGEKLADLDPSVVIIDDLSWITRSNSPTELRQLLKTFRRWVNETGNSMLILHNSGSPTYSGAPARQPRGVDIGGVPGRAGWFSREITTMSEFADTVFALCPSTFSPDHRYLKLLKSGSPPYEGGVASPATAGDDGVVLSSATTLINEVHVYQLQRSASPPPLTTAGAPAGAVPSGVGAHSSPLTKATPFPGLQFIGTSAEELHTRDYAAEVAKFEAAVLRAVEKEEKRRKLSAKEALAEGIIDGSYARYMLNE